MLNAFLKQNKISKPLIADGAMGTLLLNKGISLENNLTKLNLTNSDLITSIHKEYVEAGADIIYTHTFLANYLSLKSFSEETLVKGINVQAVTNAQKAANKTTLIAGNLGGIYTASHLQKPTPQAIMNAYEQQAQILIQAGADLIIVETLSNLEELKAALQLQTLTQKHNKPLFISITPQNNGNLLDNTKLDTWLSLVTQNKPQAIGLNCFYNPKKLAPLATHIHKQTNSPLLLKLNAGNPIKKQGLWTYPVLPKEFCNVFQNLLETPLIAIGGCCGTTPKYIKALAEMKLNET
ncbi:MAG: homocysteine S-methyltransferase family protein [bacterium]|nr:homocysteine S-methyltransferase family protein [bacterium]MBU1919010.1 homocysteine S-methyltransferase family protein [bacterium]